MASVDIANGYNEIKQNSGAHITIAPFTCDEGFQQGAVEASFLFCAGTNKVNQASHQDLISTRGGLKVGIDDTYLLGQPNVVVPSVPFHMERLCEVGL
eukprot:13250771-Ditylum_brightwellii.AAC.1